MGTQNKKWIPPYLLTVQTGDWLHCKGEKGGGRNGVMVMVTMATWIIKIGWGDKILATPYGFIGGAKQKTV